MQEITDQQVEQFLTQQEQNFKLTSMGRGFNAQQAREELERREKLPKQVLFETARQQLSSVLQQ